MNKKASATTTHDFVHQACIYRSVGELVATLVPFVLEGLARGEHVLAVTTPRNIENLTAALGAQSVQVDFVNAFDWYRHPAATLAAYHRYVAEHRDRPGHVRIIGEPVWAGLSTRNATEWKRYESMLNVAFAESPAWIVCPYDAHALDSEIIAAARRTHPSLMVGSEEQRCSEYVDPAAFFGQCDSLPWIDAPPDAFILPFLGDLHSVRQFTAMRAKAAGLRVDKASALVAAVSEIATYITRCGSGRAIIQSWWDRDEVVCQVHDPAGQITDPFAGYRPPTPTPAPDDGMWLVRQIADLLLIRSGDHGATVQVHMAHGDR